MPTAKLTSKGQVTIPKEIRERLRLKTGDRVRFTADDQGAVTLVAENGSILDLVGCLRSEVKGLSLEEIDREMQEHVAAQVLEGMKE